MDRPAPRQPITIRQLSRGDAALLDQVSTLFAEAFEDPATYATQRPSAAYHQRLLARDDFLVLTAWRNGELVGGLVAYELTKFEQERSELYIYDLAVAMSARRQGVATALIRELQRIGAARGAWVIFVQADTDEDDAAAIALYTKLGTREEVLHFDIPVRAD